jgi:hypothetical protein
MATLVFAVSFDMIPFDGNYNCAVEQVALALIQNFQTHETIAIFSARECVGLSEKTSRPVAH